MSDLFVDEVPFEEPSKELSKPSIVSSIVKDMGGVAAAAKGSSMILDVAEKAFKENKKYQGSISLLRKLIPAAISGYKLYESVKRYYTPPQIVQTDHDKFRSVLTELIGTDEWHYTSNKLSDNLFEWIIETLPSKENLKYIGLYDFNGKEIEIETAQTSAKFYLVLELTNNSITTNITISVLKFGDKLIQQGLYYQSTLIDYGDIVSLIMKSFVDDLSCEDNMIYYDGSVSTVPREKIKFDVYQFDESLKTELESAIAQKVKRGYALVGPPGTGKTTIVKKIIDNVREVPIVYLALKNLDPFTLSRSMNIIKSIGQCIVIMEDMDTMELSTKRGKCLSVLIEEMDAVKCKEGTIFIATLNEPDSVHPSLLNRRGRFDKVVFISCPSTKEEVWEVISNKYKDLSNKEYNYELSDQFLNKIIKVNFNQSDIAEMLQSLILKKMEPTEENLAEAMKEIEQTISILKEHGGFSKEN